jgi:hypothetical protein
MKTIVYHSTFALCFALAFSASGCCKQCPPVETPKAPECPPVGGLKFFTWTEPTNDCSNPACSQAAHAKNPNCSGSCISTESKCKFTCPANN